MSRIRRALAATTMAVAAAGGGLLIAAASAVPAYASAPAAPPPPPGGQTITITAQSTAQTAGKPGSEILPCATAPGADCRPQHIICWIHVDAPVAGNQVILGSAVVSCDNPVDAINLDETLSEGSAVVSVDSDNEVNSAGAFTAVTSHSCQPGLEYDNFGFATIDFPPDYTPSTGTVHHLESYVPLPSACAPPGTPIITCATPTPSTPSMSAEPDELRPHLKTC